MWAEQAVPSKNVGCRKQRENTWVFTFPQQDSTQKGWPKLWSEKDMEGNELPPGFHLSLVWCQEGQLWCLLGSPGPQTKWLWPPCPPSAFLLGMAVVQEWGQSSRFSVSTEGSAGLWGRSRQLDFWGTWTQTISVISQIKGIKWKTDRCNVLFISSQQTNTTQETVISPLCCFAVLVACKNSLSQGKRES